MSNNSFCFYFRSPSQRFSSSNSAFVQFGSNVNSVSNNVNNVNTVSNQRNRLVFSSESTTQRIRIVEPRTSTSSPFPSSIKSFVQFQDNNVSSVTSKIRFLSTEAPAKDVIKLTKVDVDEDKEPIVINLAGFKAVAAVPGEGVDPVTDVKNGFQIIEAVPQDDFMKELL